MAYNPTMYESVYGFNLLDEIHNFFPELLYDEGLFPSDNIRWMRHRIHSLFPHSFVRQQSIYNIYNAEARMRSYVQWYRENSRLNEVYIPSVATPPPPRPAAPRAAAPRVSVDVDISGAPAPPPAVRRTRAANDSMPTLFTSLLWDFRSPNFQDLPGENILNIFNQVFSDVTIAPTQAQIERASILRNSRTISAETECTICQEHGAEDAVWRELRCGHVYHQNCIDTWLASHIQCPVCRADVRTLQRAAGASGEN